MFIWYISLSRKCTLISLHEKFYSGTCTHTPLIFQMEYISTPLSECGESRAALNFWSAAIYCRFEIFWIAASLAPLFDRDPHRVAFVYFGLRRAPAPLWISLRSRVAFGVRYG